MSHHTLTAIDIGTSKISTIIVRYGENESQPRVMGFSSINSRGVKRGQIVDIHQVTEAIEESVDKAERMAGSKISKAFVTVSGPHIECINSHGVVAVSQPNKEITQDDIDRAIDAARAISLSSTRELIEVLPRDFSVDGQPDIKSPLGMNGVRLEVNTHIITAVTTNLRNIDKALDQLGINVINYVFGGLASAMSCITDTEKELGVALVDIGGGKTDMCLFVDNSLSYSVSIPIGARHITNDIAVGLRLSLESAEKIKLLLGEEMTNRVKEKDKSNTKKDEIDVSNLNLPEGITTISIKAVVDGIIRPRLEEMCEKVYAEIEKSGFSNSIPSGIVLTGGGSLTVGIVETVKRTIGLPARRGVPQGLTGLIDEVMYPQYSACAGLILYGIEWLERSAGSDRKDFSELLKSFSYKGSYKRIVDLFKSFLP